MKTLRWVISLVMLAMTLWVSLYISLTNVPFGVIAFIGSFGVFVLRGLRNIPNDPPHKGVITFFDARTKSVLNEGWNFLPFFPFVFGVVLVPVTRVMEEFTVNVKTPDRADSSVPIALTWRPTNVAPEISQKRSALIGLFKNFLNSSGNEGVKKQLLGKINERVREWAISESEGPQTWIELQRSRGEAVSILVKTIGMNGISDIPDYAQDVPTVIWMRFLCTRPRPKKGETKLEMEWIENDWKKVREIYDKLQDHQKEKLEESVKERYDLVQRLRTGNGNIVLDDLGVKLERLNVGEIKVLGAVGEAAEKQAKEEQEREAEVIELKHVQERIGDLMNPPFNYSAEQALEIIQTERGKVPKTITENKLSIAPETREMVKEVIPGIVTAIADAFGKGGKP